MTASIAAAYRAAWLFPVAGPPIRDAVLEVDAGGRIADIRSGRDRGAFDLGRAAIVPALVNAHIHLEFSDRTVPIAPAKPFSGWVRNVVAHRRSRTEPIEAILSHGIDELRRCGTVAAGEIATVDTEHYQTPSIDLTLFREIIGPLRVHWPALLDDAERHLTEVRTSRLSPGLSPHAPHTVPQDLFEQTIDLAARYAAPVAVHLAETVDELSLLRERNGDLVALMRSMGLWDASAHPLGRRPLDWLQELTRAPRALVVHGNYLDAKELDFLAESQSLSLVYCPRTHAYFGHPPHPFQKLLERGGRVALGTDGRSSNPDLNLWREAEFVSRQHPGLPSGTILDLVTRAGAEALGVGDRHGVLSVGRSANFVVVPLANDADGGDPPDLFAMVRPELRAFQNGIELDRHDAGMPCRA
ncbi:MAG: amidohydrolase family protein [Planctomycetota bacterium]|nr:amidohydrolase family protein [Planctomycetota bacterium]